MYLGNRSPWTDRYKLLHAGCRPGRNHACQFLWRSVKGFWCGEGSNFGLFHWLASSPLKHSRTTVRVCDIACFKWLNTLQFDKLLVCHSVKHCSWTYAQKSWEDAKCRLNYRPVQWRGEFNPQKFGWGFAGDRVRTKDPQIGRLPCQNMSCICTVRWI